MQIITNFTVHNLSEAKKGDLVRLDSENYKSALAIVLGPREGNLELLVLQSVMKNVQPMTVILPTFGMVANFGDNWILAPVDESELSVSEDYRSVPGVVHIGPLRTTIPIKHPNNPTRIFHLNFSTWEIDGNNSDAVPIPNWNLWANKWERERIGAKPLMAFNALNAKAAPS